jgi:hypothetical protein
MGDKLYKDGPMKETARQRRRRWEAWGHAYRAKSKSRIDPILMAINSGEPAGAEIVQAIANMPDWQFQTLVEELRGSRKQVAAMSVLFGA